MNFCNFCLKKSLKVCGWQHGTNDFLALLEGSLSSISNCAGWELKRYNEGVSLIKLFNSCSKKNLKVRGWLHRTNDYLSLQERTLSSISNCAVQGKIYELKIGKEGVFRIKFFNFTFKKVFRSSWMTHRSNDLVSL